MFSDRSLFADFSAKVERWVKNAHDSLSKVEEIGIVRVCLLDTEGNEYFVTFSNCLFLPDQAQNLISVSKLRQKGVKVDFEKESKMVAPKGTTFSFIKNKNLYLLKAKFSEFSGTSGRIRTVVCGINALVTTTWVMLGDFHLVF